MGSEKGRNSSIRLLAGAAALVLAVVLAAPAGAKTRAHCEKEYTPQRGQDGKDVIWVPTGDAMVERMLEMTAVTPADKVYDLGAGDGKIAIAAAKVFGATSVGVEYDPELARHARCLVAAEGLRRRVKIIQGDIFETEFSDATVVTLYLLPELNLRLRPTLLAMKPGTRVASNSFTMGDWDPDAQAETDDGTAYFWVVPAQAAGAWTFRAQDGSERFEVTLEQTFQKLRGSAGGAAVTGKLGGAQIELTFTDGAEPVRFTGRVDGDRIGGTITRGAVSKDYVGTRN
jgi:SAM-dependent methyltransferase